MTGRGVLTVVLTMTEQCVLTVALTMTGRGVLTVALTVTGRGVLTVALVAHVTAVILAIALEGAVDTVAIGAVEVACERRHTSRQSFRRQPMSTSFISKLMKCNSHVLTGG